MVTKVTDSVMDLSDVQQDIALNGKKVIGVTATPTLDDEATSKKYVDDTITALLAIQVPAGLGPLPWAGPTAPPGWFICNGTAVSRTTYSALFASIGTTYGVGDGSTTFNLPDTRGRFVLGRNDSGSGTNRVNRTQAQNLAGISGQENYQLQLTHMPSHSHSGTIAASGTHIHGGATTSSDGAHTHATSPPVPTVLEPGSGSVTSGGGGTQQAALSIVSDGLHSHTVTVPTNSSSHTHPVTIGFTAANTAHENTPPFLTTNYIIKY